MYKNKLLFSCHYKYHRNDSLLFLIIDLLGLTVAVYINEGCQSSGTLTEVPCNQAIDLRHDNIPLIESVVEPNVDV